MKVSIINTGISNLSSVINAFKIINVDYEIIKTKEQLKHASFFVLPGVGSFKSAMQKLEEQEFVHVIKDCVQQDGIPILGICLGMQLLFDESSEFGTCNGLGLIKGRVQRLVSDSSEYKIPNIGWNTVEIEKDCNMFPNLSKHAQSFYHVHSYYASCSDPSDVAGKIEFSGKRLCVAVERENIMGVQFHPEKSQDNGLNLLHNAVSAFEQK